MLTMSQVSYLTQSAKVAPPLVATEGQASGNKRLSHDTGTRDQEEQVNYMRLNP